jgi:low affinity Fe/Cu permease
MNRYVRPVLLLLSAGFAYFVGHTILAVGYDNLLAGAGFTTDTWQMVIKYAVPIIPIGIMTGVLQMFVVGPFNKYIDVNIKVIPSFIRVFPSYEETRSLTIKIENDSEKEISWELSIDVPEDVTLHSEGVNHIEYFTEDGGLRPGRAFRKTFQLSHTAETRRSDVLEVNVDFEDASHTEQVDVQIET